MDEPELARCHALLGVHLGCHREELERAFTQKDLALGYGGAASERERLRQAYNVVAAHLRATALRQNAAGAPAASAPTNAVPVGPMVVLSPLPTPLPTASGNEVVP